MNQKLIYYLSFDKFESTNSLKIKSGTVGNE